MPTVQVDVHSDIAIEKALDDYCRRHDVVMHHFIQEALIDRLDELEDVEDLKRIRHEPTRPSSDVLFGLDLDGDT